ncbi:MAG: hypothetical protein RhofKO_33810 [Rhodothermales bacterium]
MRTRFSLSSRHPQEGGISPVYVSHKFIGILVSLLGLIALAPLLPSHAQTVHVDSLHQLVVQLQLGPEQEHWTRAVPTQDLTRAYVESRSEFQSWLQTRVYPQHDGHVIRPFALAGQSSSFTRNALFQSSVLDIPEKAWVLTLLYDQLAFEGNVTVLALWERDGDVLHLEQLLSPALPSAFSGVFAEAYGILPDDSMLLVLRFLQEGYWHKLVFMRLPGGGTYDVLIEREFMLDPAMETEMAGFPNIASTEYLGIGYAIPDDFSSMPIVRLDAIKHIDGHVWGEMTSIPVPDPEAEPDTVNLWALAQQK